MKVTFWGTRGSIPTVNLHTHTYGGNTPCVSVEHDDTILILDAGSGIRHLAESGILEQYRKIHIILTHLHMDHIQGLGFFGPFFQVGREIDIWGPRGATHLTERLTRYLSPPLFPVRLRDFVCDLKIMDIPMKPFNIGPFIIHAAHVCHPGPTLGFRVTCEGSSVTYIPDHEPALAARDFPGDPQWTSGYNIIKDSDVLIHDAQFSDEEYNARIGWGHSSMSHAIQIAQLCRVRRLVLFHHDPAHTDENLDELFSRYSLEDYSFPIELAREQTSIVL